MATATKPYGGRYTGGAIAFHWTIAALIVVNLLLGFFQDSLFKGTVPLHKSIGLTVLALSVLRLAWRLTHRPPPLPAEVGGWQKGLAHLTHWLFYALMILLPLSGWVFTSAGARRYSTSYFGLFRVPWIVGQDPALNDAVFDKHVQLAWIAVALIVLHVAGALKHQLIDRNRFLLRMMPVRAD